MSEFLPFLSIVWDVSPVIVTLGPLSLRWYGILFSLGFVFGYVILERIFKNEHVPLPLLDRLTIYMIIATVIGARLGHVFFYEPAEYLKNPIEILYVWEGGLASHGAAIGMFISLWLYQRRTPETTFLWTVDRVVLTVALGGALIRMGNLFNSEIVGEPTELPWGFLFVNAGKGLSETARHPAQLYEALWYFATWGLLMWMYWSRKGLTRPGLLFGVFLLMVFGFRFVVEFFKEVQVDFERDMVLYMGQWLSIPLILAGIYFTATAFRRPMEPYLPKV